MQVLPFCLPTEHSVKHEMASTYHSLIELLLFSIRPLEVSISKLKSENCNFLVYSSYIWADIKMTPFCFCSHCICFIFLLSTNGGATG